ncbi:MAG: hypothetical protein IJV56_02675 [Neisseriaceae bacterium]|nr:hypothetical protein [Neisseriaceae bacterium]
MVLFLGGIQLVSIGILGEYLGRVSEEVKRRPVYVIADIVGNVATNNGKNGCGVVLEKNQNDG